MSVRPGEDISGDLKFLLLFYLSSLFFHSFTTSLLSNILSFIRPSLSLSGWIDGWLVTDWKRERVSEWLRDRWWREGKKGRETLGWNFHSNTHSLTPSLTLFRSFAHSFIHSFFHSLTPSLYLSLPTYPPPTLISHPMKCWERELVIGGK